MLLDGRDITDVPANKRDMGMVFQAYSLFPNLTVAENVAFGLRVRRRGKAEQAGRAAELLELVGLADRGDRYPHQLSGGQQQRVALARALAVAPQVLLLDEPLSALDAQVRVQLREEIRRIQLELGITTVFVTHDQAEALSVADRVGVLRAGRLEQVAEPGRAVRAPGDRLRRRVRRHDEPAARRPWPDGEVQLLGTRRPVAGAAPPAGPVVALVRPEALLVHGRRRRRRTGGHPHLLRRLDAACSSPCPTASRCGSTSPARSAGPHPGDGGHRASGRAAGARGARRAGRDADAAGDEA